jgi:surface antigen
MSGFGMMSGGIAGNIFGEIGGSFGEGRSKRLANHHAEIQRGNANYYNKLALDYWRKTGVGGQMKELIKAGLNPARIYGGSGATGQSINPTSGNSALGSNNNFDSGMMMAGIQNQMTKAQIENIEADTKQKKAIAEKTSGVDTKKAFTEIDNLIANTKNQDSLRVLTDTKAEFQNIENALAERSFDSNASIIDNRAKELMEEVHRLRRRNRINDATEDEAVKAIHLGIIRLNLENANLNKNLELTEQRIWEIEQNVNQNYNELVYLYEKMNVESKRNWNDYKLRKHQTRINQEQIKLQQLLGIEGLKQGEAKLYIDAIGKAFQLSPQSGSIEWQDNNGNIGRKQWNRN